MKLCSVVVFVEWMEVEDLLFLLYISGFIGKFKGVFYIVGGYMVFVVVIFKYVFDYYFGDIFWYVFGFF